MLRARTCAPGAVARRLWVVAPEGAPSFVLAPTQPERSHSWSLFSSPRPHLAAERLSAPSREEGRSGQQRCGAGVTWVVEAELAVHPTGATPDPGGSFLLSGQWDALFPKMLIPSSLCQMLPSLSLFFMENNLGTEKSRQEARMCLLLSLSSPSSGTDETPAVATLAF